MFWYVLVLAPLLTMDVNKPTFIAPFESLAACENRAGELNKEQEKLLEQPSSQAKGLKFVCAHLVPLNA